MQDLSIVVMSDLPAEEVELIEDPDEVHKIYRQSFIDEQVRLFVVDCMLKYITIMDHNVPLWT